VVIRTVFDRWQRLWKKPVTRLIATNGWLQSYGLVRALQVVTIAPDIETVLCSRLIDKGFMRQYFGFESAMKAFILALGLRVIRPRVANFYA